MKICTLFAILKSDDLFVVHIQICTMRNTNEIPSVQFTKFPIVSRVNFGLKEATVKVMKDRKTEKVNGKCITWAGEIFLFQPVLPHQRKGFSPFTVISYITYFIFFLSYTLSLSILSLSLSLSLSPSLSPVSCFNLSKVT